MNTDDLYKQSRCPQCGQSVLDSASFCPHCGYVKKKSWWEGLFSGGRREGTAETGVSGGTGLSVSTILGFGFAAYLAYKAVSDESIQSLIMAILVLFAVTQSWLAARKRARQGLGEPKEEKEADDPLEQKFFCENCGTRVAGDATKCPKCGMRFG
jgi:predicted amidophosphoribosyltransferase